MPWPHDTVIIYFEYTDVNSCKDLAVTESCGDTGDAYALASDLYRWSLLFFIKLYYGNQTNMNHINGYRYIFPDSKVHEAHMGPTWDLSAQMGPMLAPLTLLSGLPCL